MTFQLDTSGVSRLRLACTALGRRIMAGYPTKDGLRLKEPRHDVTSDALKAIIEKIGIGHQEDITSDGELICTIAVIAPAKAEGAPT